MEIDSFLLILLQKEIRVKYIIFIILFLPIVYISFKKRNWYLFLFFIFYPILPDTFAIELSNKLPLVTGSRILLLLLLIIWIFQKSLHWKLKIPILLLFYFITNLIISIVNLQNGVEEINRIFRLTIENFLLVIIIKDLIKTKSDFFLCIDCLIYSGVCLSVIGILQTTINIDISTIFNLIPARISGSISNRMNMIRAFGTFNAITFGCFCTMLILIILYQYERTNKAKYILGSVIILVALLCSMTRSAIMVLCATLLIMLLIRNIRFLNNYLKYIPLLLLFFLGTLLLKPSLVNNFIEILKACLNVLGANFHLSEGFGANANDASYSRNVQWTALYYMAKEGNLLFGYGYNAFIKGKLFYYFRQFSSWTKATALDVGFVSIAVESGLIGLFLNLLLWLGIYISSLKRSKHTTTYNFDSLSTYIFFMYILLNISSSFINDKLIWIFIGLFYANKQWNFEYGEAKFKRSAYEQCNHSCYTQTM